MFPLLTSSASVAAWLSGTATGLGLFMVVGAQSAYIIKQGVMRAHLGSILAVCAATDLVMIFCSVLGLQALITWMPGLTEIIRWGGVVFLAWYGLRSGLRAWRPAADKGESGTTHYGRGAAIAGAFGFTLLNPHFWLDIVVVGSLAQSFTDARYAFALGATTASLVWLALLGCGARLLAPLFRNPRAWRLLDAVIAIVMWTLAISLSVRHL